ncbi:MAG: Wzz/FepE/Etk N-terminal domain-containing protein [Candidatus Manganitrophaceae bacterium]
MRGRRGSKEEGFVQEVGLDDAVDEMNRPAPGVDEEIELIDYLRVLWKRRKLILLGTVLSVVVAGVISLFLPPVYEATAQIRIGRVWDKEVENPYLASALVGSDAFLMKVIDRVHLPITPYQMKKQKIIEMAVFEGGVAGQKLPVLLNVLIRSPKPQEAVDIGNTVAGLLVEEHQKRFEERLKEYRAYENDLEREVPRIEGQIHDLEGLIKKQSLTSTMNAPSVILLQAQLEQKSVQLLTFKKELKEVRINNASSMATENTKLVAPPVLPKEHVSPKINLNMAVAGVLGLFGTLMLSFFLEYLERVRQSPTRA